MKRQGLLDADIYIIILIKTTMGKIFFEYFHSLFNNYTEYLETMTPDKIVCVFNNYRWINFIFFCIYIINYVK
jgi:hypothetical protein